MVYGIPKAAAYYRFLFQFRAVGGILYCFGFVETGCELVLDKHISLVYYTPNTLEH
jgi:hypothetical protein